MNKDTVILIVILVSSIVLFILCREFFCWYFKITEVSNSIKKISESLSSSKTEDIKEIVKQVLYGEREYSLNTIYDENGLIGHEWNQYISEGHWVKMIFDERNDKFISVKHYRTDKNTTENFNPDERIKQEMKFNSQEVFGDVDENNNRRKKSKHFSLKEKIVMRK